jgi:adenosyl cobinamide kinase/adenosyl cobinamide phosphate guanylyltransferase/cobalamin synthase
VDAVRERPGITLVLGGARSGKSEVAEGLVAAIGGPVAYVATGPRADPIADPDWAARLDAHRRRRPASWTTVEVPAGADLGEVLRAVDIPVILDSLGTWIAGLEDFGGESNSTAVDDPPVVTSLVAALVHRRAVGRPTVIVTEEVGLGVHPPTGVGVAFRDALGRLNRRVAGVADRVLLVVVGRVHELGPQAVPAPAGPHEGIPPLGPQAVPAPPGPVVQDPDTAPDAGQLSPATVPPATVPPGTVPPATVPPGTVFGGARRAVGFLTAFGGATTPDTRTFWWFPATGGAIGAVLGTVWWATAKAWPQALAAVIVVALDLAITGMLHLDGLVDAADGLLPHLDRARRLAVMREPSVGAFGVGVAAVVLIGRWAALSVARPSVWLLVGLWVASRTAMAVVATVVPYARADEGGLATAFLPPAGAGRLSAPTLAIAGLGIAGAVGAVVAWGPLGGGVALVAGVVAAAGVVWLACRRIGGFTGDVLGAAGVTLETVALIVAAAKW